MSNVTSLNGGPTGEKKPEPECVKEIQLLLDRARSGDVIGVAYVTANFDSSQGAGWGGYVGSWSMIGALQCLVAKFTAVSVEKDF